MNKVGVLHEGNIEDYNKGLFQYIVPSEVLSHIQFEKTNNQNFPIYAVRDETKKIGRKSKRNSKYRTIVSLKDTGQILYDTQITTDENRRRIVEEPHSENHDTAILLLGCSFTFGEGVNDYETFASLLSKKFKGANVYNLGVGGSTESQIFYEMNHGYEDLYKSIKEKKLIIVDTFFDAHLLRQACDFSCYGYNRWLLDKPKYVIGEGNKLEFKGFFKDFYPPNLLFKFISESAIFVYFNIQGSYINSERNHALTATALTSIKNEYSKSHEILGFYTFFHEYTNSQSVNYLSKMLMPNGIKIIISNKEVILDKFKDILYIPDDGHPNANGHKLIAESIGWALERDFPKILDE